MKAAEERPAERKTPRTVRVPKNALLVRFFLHPAGKTLLILTACAMIAFAGVFVHFYNIDAKLIDERLRGGAYTASSQIYAAPGVIAVGDETTPNDLAALLRHAGYNENRNNPIGYYTLRPDSIDIFPGAESYFDQEARGRQIRCAAKFIRIVSLGDNSDRPMYELEPQLITNLTDRKREKQRRRSLRGHPGVSPQRRPFRRRQALLPAFRLRPRRHRPLRLDRPQARPQRAGRLHADHAARAQHVPHAGPQLAPQTGRDHDHHAARTEAHQRADLRALLQSDRSRIPRQLRNCAASAKPRRLTSAKTSARLRCRKRPLSPASRAAPVSTIHTAILTACATAATGSSA